MLSFDDIEVHRESGLSLDTLRQAGSYPQFRFMGSKHRLLPWLAGIFRELEFGSALDAFSGSGNVAYLLKTMGKTVTTNDFLRFGLWTTLRNFLRLFRGVHKKYLGGYVAMLELSINLERITPDFVSSLVAVHSLRT